MSVQSDNPFLSSPTLVASMRLVRRTSSNEVVESPIEETKRLWFVLISEGIYTTAVQDIGNNVTSTVSFEAETLNTEDKPVVFEVRISEDNVTWSDWNAIETSTPLTFRYIQYRAKLQANNIFKLPMVKKWLNTIDVPDIMKAGQAEIDVGGTTVSYGYDYFNEPYIVATSIGADTKAEIVSKGKSSFVAKVINASGTDVGGYIDWHTKGY